MKIPFDLDKAKSGMKVVTPDGRKVRIICWDRQYGYPIVGLVEQLTSPYYEMYLNITNEGKTNECFNVLLDDGKPEKTKFETAVESLIDGACHGICGSAKEEADELLKIANKEVCWKKVGEDLDDFECVLNSDFYRAKVACIYINQLDQWSIASYGDKIYKGFKYIKLSDLNKLSRNY